MRNILLIIFILSSLFSFEQERQRWGLSLQLQPELTFYQNQYSYRWKEKYTKNSFNIGIASALHYNLTNRLFAGFGLGYISRRLTTTVFLNQAKLPAPHFSETKELNNTRYLSYRTFQIPINAGYNIIVRKGYKAFFTGGISANYLINAYYKVDNSKYDAAYKKGYWQGVSVNGGIGTDIRLTKKILLTNTISYSIINPVHTDTFLFSQDDQEIAIPHKYLSLSTGLKIPL